MEKSISSDIIRGHIDTIILYSLLNGNKHAQQISDSIEEKSENSYLINQATLYSSLKRLENLKLVNAYWHDSESGRRRYFKITDKGIETVKDNLSNWTYSRAIINKLIDTPETAVKTQIVEVPVPAPVLEPVQNKSSVESIVAEKSQKDSQINSTEQNPPIQETQEINFRAILDGLIQTQNSFISDETEVLKPLDKNVDEEKSVKQNFNETISKETLSQKKNNVNKIDFGDLVIKAHKEGYKLRISSKESKTPRGIIPINKVRFISALSLFLICLLEILIITLSVKSSFRMSGLAIAAVAIVLAIFPIVSTVKFFTVPSKTVREIQPDSILTAAIVVFNLLIVTVALNLLFGADFKNTFTLVVYLIAPCILFADILIYFSLKYFIANKYYKKKGK